MPSYDEESRYCSWVHSRICTADVAPEPLFSDSHPEYVGNAEDMGPQEMSPEGNIPLKDVPAAADVNAPAEAMLSQDYVQKSVIFMIILAAVIFIVRRRRQSQPDSRLEKSTV